MWVSRVMRLRAAPWGTYRSFSTTRRIRRRVASRVGPFPLMTRETVATETPASRATSRIVTAGAGRDRRGCRGFETAEDVFSVGPPAM